MERVESVLNAAFNLRGLTSGALLGGLLLAVFWKKGLARPVILAMAVSLGVMILITSLFKEQVFWPWYTLIGTLVTVATAFSLAPVFPPARAIERPSAEPEAPARL